MIQFIIDAAIRAIPTCTLWRQCPYRMTYTLGPVVVTAQQLAEAKAKRR